MNVKRPDGSNPKDAVSPYWMLPSDDEASRHEAIRRKQDEFLDVYSLYVRTHIPSVLDELRLKVYELYLLDSRFSFQI